jgi:hypothetical protein
MRFARQKSPIFVNSYLARWLKIMVMKKAMLPFLKSDAEKGAARAEAAKQQVRAAKAALKRARKLFKAAKKSAKQARKKLEATVAATTRPPGKPSRRQPVRLGQPAAKAPAAKAPKKAPKKARKKAAVSRKPRRASKVRAPAAADHMRSASDVAKSVIERLRSAPPTLPPAPVIPPDPDTTSESPEVKPE